MLNLRKVESAKLAVILEVCNTTQTSHRAPHATVVQIASDTATVDLVSCIRPAGDGFARSYSVGKDAVMGNKHFFAFLGVLALLSANLAGYYFLWPVNSGRLAKGLELAREEKGETRLVAAKIEKKASLEAPPKDLPEQPKKSALNDDQAIHKLLEHIRQENQEVPAPRSLPASLSEPLIGSFVLPTMPDVAVTSAITPKVAPGLWLTQVERTGNRAKVTAKLRHPGSDRIAAEFVLECDRVESLTSPFEIIVAHGQVAFHGPGVKGSCGKLTIPLHEARLFFEEYVQFHTDAILSGSSAGTLLADRLMWEPLGPALLPLRPASLGPPN